MIVDYQKCNEAHQPRRLPPSIRRFCLLLFLAGCLLGLIGSNGAAQKKDPSKRSSANKQPKKEFGGKYPDLNPWQRSLVDDAIRRANLLSKGKYLPEKSYNELSSSDRSTFEAVTHALMTTKLTDESGASLGAALDLMKSLEEIAGEKRDARGDQQFRVYFNLKPAAADTLAKCREFKRGGDNTVYHFGYPINYRLQGGTPSIQISLSRDGSRADVDVDYRSSKFPAAVINGHLTSANSDVRAGHNYETHVDRWSGLANWWGALFGLNMGGKKPRPEERDNREIPPTPPLKDNAKFNEVVENFLRNWLIEQRPDISASYFGHESYGCARDATNDMGKVSDTGFARWRFYQSMKDVNRQLGKVTDLSGTLETVSPSDDRLKPIKHPHEDQYLLVRVPPEVAALYDCDLRSGKPLLSGEISKRYKDVYGVAFKIRLPDERGGSLLALWRKEAGYWRIVSFDVVEGGASLSLRSNSDSRMKTETDVGTPDVPETMDGNQAAIERITEFYRTWLVTRNYDKAISYFSPRSFACVHAADEGKSKALNSKKEQMLIREGLQKVAQAAGEQKQLDEMMRPIAQIDPELKVIKHANERAFTIVAISDQFGSQLLCGKDDVPQQQAMQAIGDKRAFGGYYASTFQLNLYGDPGYLWSVWAMEGGKWMIIYWKVIAS
jgi:hypothetical protein